MKRITLYIAEPQYEAFQALAATRQQPYSELVREALNRYLADEGEKTARKRVRPRKRA